MEFKSFDVNFVLISESRNKPPAALRFQRNPQLGRKCYTETDANALESNMPFSGELAEWAESAIRTLHSPINSEKISPQSPPLPKFCCESMGKSSFPTLLLHGYITAGASVTLERDT